MDADGPPSPPVATLLLGGITDRHEEAKLLGSDRCSDGVFPQGCLSVKLALLSYSPTSEGHRVLSDGLLPFAQPQHVLACIHHNL